MFRSMNRGRVRGLKPVLALKSSSNSKLVLPKYQVHPQILKRIMNASAVYFQVKLSKDPSSAKVHEHILTRQIRPETTAAFGIGYAPLPWPNQTMPYLASRSVS